ncbi:MAG: hypothetical protein U0359_29255 [Byssovorax sp.]
MNQQVSVDAMTTTVTGDVVVAGTLSGKLLFGNTLLADDGPNSSLRPAFIATVGGAAGDPLFSTCYARPVASNYHTGRVGIDGTGVIHAALDGVIEVNGTVGAIAALGAAPWAKTFGNAIVPQIHLMGLAVDAAGNSRALFMDGIGGGLSPSYDYGGGPIANLALVAFDPAGQHLFSKSVSTYPDTWISGTAAGETYLTNFDLGALSKLDASGSMLWSKVYKVQGSPAGRFDVDPTGALWSVFSSDAVIDFGAGAIATGPGKVMAVVKLDPQGNQVWVKTFPVSANFAVKNIQYAVGSAGLAMMVTLTGSVDFGGGISNSGTYLVKLGPSGAFEWQRALVNGQALAVFDYALTMDPSGSVIVGSQSQKIDFGDGPPLLNKQGILLVKLSP